MKYLILTFCVLLGLSACNFSGGNQGVTGFIPGIYVSEWRTEYAQAMDTLVLTRISSSESGQYQIVRRTFYLYTQSVKPFPPELRVDKWSASWSASDERLTVVQSGRIITFQPDELQLKMGVRVYNKLQ